MSFLLLFGLCFVFLSTDGFYSSAQQMIIASQGQRITLPCGLPSIKSCSSINWTMEGQFLIWASEVVTDGRVISSKAGRYHLLQNCSLEIAQVVADDARRYTCESKTHNSSVSLRIPEIQEALTPAEGTVELHCFLNTFKGFLLCNNNLDVHIKWTAQDDTPLNGERFRFENQDACFSKLIISKKPTDHHRTWRCHLTQNNEVKASVSYKTTIKGGLEEVFAAVGESVSLACRNTSSLSFGGHAELTVQQETLTFTSKDSSLVIDKLSPLKAGDYLCTDSSAHHKAFNKVRLHTLDVTARKENQTLTCVLMCAEECDESFNLTWSAANEDSWRSRSMKVNNTLILQLILPVSPKSSDEIICSVYREGSLMASKKWRPDTCKKTLQKLVWLGFIGLLMFTAAGLYIYRKRKQNKDAENKQTSIAMAHVYDVIEDEEVEKQRPLKREAPTTDDGLYNLLQAVN